MQRKVRQTFDFFSPYHGLVCFESFPRACPSFLEFPPQSIEYLNLQETRHSSMVMAITSLEWNSLFKERTSFWSLVTGLPISLPNFLSPNQLLSAKIMHDLSGVPTMKL